MGEGNLRARAELMSRPTPAFLVLLRRQLGTASKAKDKVIELEQDVKWRRQQYRAEPSTPYSLITSAFATLQMMISSS